MSKKPWYLHPDYIRSTIFGIEDALVSTTGVVAGVSAGAGDRSVALLASLVAVAVEALSMGAGQYLSEEAVHQMSKEEHTDSLWLGATCMFLAYIAAGMIPVLPLMLVPFGAPATVMSIALALGGLFILGYIKGKVVGVPATQSAFKMFVVGGLATLIGIAVGHLFKVS